MKTALEKLEDVTAIATSGGNYDCNAYMHGMANGLILARAIMRDDKGEVPYLDTPKEWLDSRGEQNHPPESVSSAVARVNQQTADVSK